MVHDPLPAPGTSKGRIAAMGLAALAGLALLLALFAAFGTPKGQSYAFNVSWAVAFAEALEQGTLYPRHLPTLWAGLGGLDFFFYGPLPFYVSAGPAAWICQGCSVQTTFALAGGMLWVGSGLSFWLFAARLLPGWPALVAAAAYAVMPYHLLDWFFRQAAGEFAAYLFLPFAAHGLLLATRKGRPGVTLAIGVAGMAFCHLPTFLLTAHVLGLIGLVWWLRAPRARLRPVLQAAAMSAAGVAIAAIYWLPAIALLGDVSPEGLSSSDLVPSAWYLIGPGTWPYNTFRMTLFLMQAGALALTAGAILAARGTRRRDLILWAGIPAALTVFLNTSLSAPIWDHWIIDRVQFPFRLTVFSDLAAALSVGALAAMWREGALPPLRLRPPQIAAAAGAGMLVLALAGTTIGSMRAVGGGLAAKGEEIPSIGPGEYLPPPVFAPMKARIDAEGEPIWNLPWPMLNFARTVTGPGAEEVQPALVAPRTWAIPAGTTPDETVALPYWLHLRAETASGVPVELSPDPENGLLRLGPANGEAVTVRLPPHWSERMGLALSAIGMLLAGAFVFWGRRGRWVTA